MEQDKSATEEVRTTRDQRGVQRSHRPLRPAHRYLLKAVHTVFNLFHITGLMCVNARR